MKCKWIAGPAFLVILPGIVFGAALASSPPTFPATTNDAVDIRYKLRQGQRIEAKITVKIATSMSAGGQKQEQTQELLFKVNYGVKSVGSDGSAAVLLAIGRVMARQIDNPFQYYDSDVAGDLSRDELKGWRPFLKQPIEGTVFPSGLVTAIEMQSIAAALEKQEGRRFGPDELPVLLDQLEFLLDPILRSVFVQFAPGPVKAGSVYAADKHLVFLPGIGIYSTAMEHTVSSVAGDKKRAVIKTRGKLDSAHGVQVKRLSAAGWILFDLEQGNIVESYESSNSTFSATLQGRAVKLTRDAIIACQVEVKR